MFPMPAARLFLKHLSELLAQTRHAGPAQGLNFHQNRIVHSCFPLVSVNHSHMNALCRPTGKVILSRARTRSQGRRYSPVSTRHNVSNTWLLTRRSAVRFLFGEANISHFEILSAFGLTMQRR